MTNEKTAYQKYEEQLKKAKEEPARPRLLLHSCCGPCSTAVLEQLADVFDLTVLYYNPNIYPKAEYERRRDELFRLLEQLGQVSYVELPYREEEYYQQVKGLEELEERSKRCYKCYFFRMEQAASYAKEHQFDYFTTTLSISPYKNSAWINEIGKELEQKYGVSYLFSDFKKKGGYQRSLELSKQYQLYRQDYCGCVFSWEKRRKE